MQYTVLIYICQHEPPHSDKGDSALSGGRLAMPDTVKHGFYRQICAQMRQGLVNILICYAPPSQNLSGVPAEKNRIFSDHLPGAIDEHTRLINAVNACAVDIMRGWMILKNAEAVLAEDELSFLDCRYRYGMTWDETAEKMHFSNQSISRIRKTLLEKIENL